MNRCSRQQRVCAGRRVPGVIYLSWPEKLGLHGGQQRVVRLDVLGVICLSTPEKLSLHGRQQSVVRFDVRGVTYRFSPEKLGLHGGL
jgi:hypothetical protein